MKRVGGYDAASLRAISEFNDRVVGDASLRRAKPASPSDLKEFEPILKVRYIIQLSASQGAPRCEAPARAANGTTL